jgi:hypothetical protein
MPDEIYGLARTEPTRKIHRTFGLGIDEDDVALWILPKRKGKS